MWKACGTCQQESQPSNVAQQSKASSKLYMQRDMTPWHNKACIQSWKMILVGRTTSCKDLSARIACGEKVIPQACSHFLNWAADTVVDLVAILAQLSQISTSWLICKSVCFVYEDMVATWPSSSWLPLAKKTFLHKEQNLEPLSPFMDNANLWAAPSMMKKPRCKNTLVYALAALMSCGSSNWSPWR